jgi:hypothetical protein
MEFRKMENEVRVGVVIRADGTVPFDESCSPEVRAHILQHLTDQGHIYHPVAGTRHVKIQNWKKPQR